MREQWYAEARLPPAVCLLLTASAIMPRVFEELRIMIVAGEPSGDAHAAALVQALRHAAPHTEFEFFGATGASLRAAGVNTIVRTDDLGRTGLEAWLALPKFWQAFKLLKQAAFERQPHAVILVDWPDFNLRLAHALHRRGLRTIYYISPQLWAWRSYRVRTIRRDVDLLLSILTFEREWYAQRGVTHVEFVGHPLAGEVRAHYDRKEFCRLNDLDPTRPLISLLPGSRRRELNHILPPLLEAAALISFKRPEVQFAVVVAPSRSIQEVTEIIKARRSSLPLPEKLRIVTHMQTREALAASDAAAVASGTATLEATILNTPLVVVYNESVLNWYALRPLINTEHFGLVNLIAGERLATELLQNDLTPERLADELVGLLEPEKNALMRTRLREVTERLGAKGTSERAAETILRALREWTSPAPVS